MTLKTASHLQEYEYLLLPVFISSPKLWIFVITRLDPLDPTISIMWCICQWACILKSFVTDADINDNTNSSLFDRPHHPYNASVTSQWTIMSVCWSFGRLFVRSLFGRLVSRLVIFSNKAGKLLFNAPNGELVNFRFEVCFSFVLLLDRLVTF